MNNGLSTCIDLVNYFQTLNISIDDNKSIFRKEDESFLIELSNDNLDFMKSMDLKLNLNNEIFTINNHKIKVLSSLQTSCNIYKSYFSVSEFQSEYFNNKNSFFRLIIPSSKKIVFNNYFNNLINIDYSNNRYNRNGIHFEVKNIEFYIYQIEDFLVMENLFKIDFEDFDKISRLALASLGFISGYVPMELGYYFMHDDLNKEFIDFKFTSTFIDTYESSSSLITLNAHQFYSSLDKNEYYQKHNIQVGSLVEKLNQKLTPITYELFSKLCSEMLNENFSNIIFSILSINDNKNKVDLSLKGALYSVSLEMATNYICEKNKDKLYYIEDEKKRKELLKELRLCSKTFFEKNKLHNFKDSPIDKKILNINSPTNSDKLTKPFDILSIKLNSYEKKIIKHRNNFLHGNNFMKDDNFEKKTFKLLYISLELNYLINALILKYIGYSGYIRNLAKSYLYEYDLEELENEHFYKKL